MLRLNGVQEVVRTFSLVRELGGAGGSSPGQQGGNFFPFVRKGGELVRHREKREAAQRLKKEEDDEEEEASLYGSPLTRRMCSDDERRGFRGKQDSFSLIGGLWTDHGKA